MPTVCAKAKEDQIGYFPYGLEAHPIPLDRSAISAETSSKRLFCKLKNWRRVATRYDRIARNYLSGLALAALIIART
jgi:hypothetical protein